MEFATNQTYTAIGAGLEAWVSIAKSIRIATRGGMKYVPLKAGGSFIDTEKATSYYTVYLINLGCGYLGWYLDSHFALHPLWLPRPMLRVMLLYEKNQTKPQDKS
jgi:hypothetical protein